MTGYFLKMFEVNSLLIIVQDYIVPTDIFTFITIFNAGLLQTMAEGCCAKYPGAVTYNIVKLFSKPTASALPKKSNAQEYKKTVLNFNSTAGQRTQQLPVDPLNLQGTPVAEPEPRLQPTTIRKAQRSTVQKIEELHKENIPLCGTRKNQDTVSRKPVSISPLNANRPNPFILPRTTAPLIGSGESMRKKIIAATEMHTILAYLEESNFSQADILLRNMKCLGRELTKLAESSGFDDAENLSEEMTSRYFKIFQRRLLDTVVVAVCRGMSSNPSFYGPLCQMLNEYLHKCGLYTRSVEVGRRAVDADFNDMRSIPQVVHDPKKNAMIAQVERLPYYIDYKTEEGTEGYFFYEGRMVIMKYQKEHNG